MIVGKMMKMRRTCIDGRTSLARWRVRGMLAVRIAFTRVRVVVGWITALIKNAVTAMLPTTPRHDHQSLVNLLLNGVIHLQMKTLNIWEYAPKSCSVVPKYLGSDG
jgi:hypothetical protein